MNRFALAVLLSVGFGPGAVHAANPPNTENPRPIASTNGTINGTVKNSKTGKAIEGAIVILQCSCLAEQREVRTNARGIYSFRNLPPGAYTVQVLAGQANVSKIVSLPKAASFRANFAMNPRENLVRRITVEASPVATRTTSTVLKVEMEQAKSLPLGSNTSRDFTAVVDLSPTASQDSAGIQAQRRTRRAQRRQMRGSNREEYLHVPDNDRFSTRDDALSTFSIDVDTASYSNVRRFLNEGSPPPADAVRIEELINYFDYDYPEPRDEHPFSVTTEVAPCPWNADAQLVRIGLKGASMQADRVPPRNLVFLVDVSGSMADANKLPLVQRSLEMLVDRLRSTDTVSLVVYAGGVSVALEPTSGANKRKIREAIGALSAGGSTWGEGGLELAYRLAEERFERRGINRVVLATDGDFNVGRSGIGSLQRLIEKKRETGVSLSVLGFGMHNLDDATMETLADKGNGNYAYIDTLEEAHKVLVEESDSTLVTIAKDVKIQVEMNPANVESYRLIGYANRRLAHRDFDDDKKDAGEIGAGHTVTALYEVVPNRERVRVRRSLRYQSERRVRTGHRDELMLVRLRYKPPKGKQSRLLEVPVRRPTGRSGLSTDLRFAAAVAGFGMLLRDSPHKGSLDWCMVEGLATRARGSDPNGYRAAFVDLVDRAAALDVPASATRRGVSHCD